MKVPEVFDIDLDRSILPILQIYFGWPGRSLSSTLKSQFLNFRNHSLLDGSDRASLP